MELPRQKKVLLSLVITIFFVGSLETLLRVAGFHFESTKQTTWNLSSWEEKGVGQDPTLPWSWTPIPGALCNIHGFPDFRFNDKGFRGPIFNEKKAPGVVRVVCMGDSSTLGWGVEDNKTYCYLLQGLLQSKLNKSVETINAGVFGYASSQGLHMLSERILDLDPDVITVSYNWNDHAPAIPLGDKDGVLPDSRLPRINVWTRMQHRLSGFHTYQLVQFMVAKLNAAPAPMGKKTEKTTQQGEDVPGELPQILRVPPKEYERNMAEFARIARAHGILPIFMTQPFISGEDEGEYEEFMDRKQNEYNATMIRVAQQHRMPWIDISRVFDTNKPLRPLFSSHVHPTAKGHRLIARALAVRIASELTARPN